MAKQYRIRISETAESDMYAAYYWIEAEAPRSAAKWLAGLLALGSL
jgi:plasmid stabilization system protein ParE